MSKLYKDLVEGAIDKILAYSNGETIQHDGNDVKGKKRKFVETIDLQIALKNYDPQKDKRFAGTIKLPLIPRPKLRLCILGDAFHCEKAAGLGLDFKNADGLKAFNKNKTRPSGGENAGSILTAKSDMEIIEPTKMKSMNPEKMKTRIDGKGVGGFFGKGSNGSA